jgi:hypothetical protein
MRPIRALILPGAVLTVALCVAGCGASATTGHAHVGAQTQTDVARVVTVADRPQRTTSLRAVQLAAIPEPRVSWPTYYDGSIWAKRDDGYLVRIDPRTNRQIARLGHQTPLQFQPDCQGIGAGGGAVWSCRQASITRIDATQNRIIAAISVGKAHDQGRLVFAAGRIWVITGTYGNRLVGIDTATNQPGPSITLPYGCSDLAPGGAALWVLCPLANHVVKVDVTDRRVIGSVAVAAPYRGWATRTDLWVGSNQSLVRIDASTLKPTVIFQNAGPGMDGDITIDANHVWVSTNDGSLNVIDANTNTITEHITTPSGLGGGALLAATGSIWLIAENNGTLLRLRST